jgi:hypothetical protein
VTEIVDIARRLAAAAPGPGLACPVCGVVLKARSLERHLTRVHPGAGDAGRSWRGQGWRGGSLAWDGGALRWRSRTGLRRRTVGPVRAVVAGSTVSSRSQWTSVTNFPDDGGPTVQERSGAYLLVRGEGGAITVRCHSGATLRKAWSGWEPGGRATRWQITVDPGAFVALAYLLADVGVLRPKAG